jgi:hypothetical protein
MNCRIHRRHRGGRKSRQPREFRFFSNFDTRKKVGENHHGYATSLNNLALLYMNMHDCSKAEPLYQKVLEITKNVLGENHPNYPGGNLAENVCVFTTHY